MKSRVPCWGNDSQEQRGFWWKAFGNVGKTHAEYFQNRVIPALACWGYNTKTQQETANHNFKLLQILELQVRELLLQSRPRQRISARNSEARSLHSSRSILTIKSAVHLEEELGDRCGPPEASIAWELVRFVTFFVNMRLPSDSPQPRGWLIVDVHVLRIEPFIQDSCDHAKKSSLNCNPGLSARCQYSRLQKVGSVF
eukprot:scaffold18563_cov132-Cylindrotheca_fusiformis.AAC.4